MEKGLELIEFDNTHYLRVNREENEWKTQKDKKKNNFQLNGKENRAHILVWKSSELKEKDYFPFFLFYPLIQLTYNL